MASVNPRREFPFVIEGVNEPDTARRVFLAMSHLDLEDLLRAREVSPDWKWGIDNYSGLWDRMSLLRAVEDNRLDIVQLIVTHSCHKNPPDNYGMTPLHKAAQKGQTQVCRFIIDSVQDKNPPDNAGWTPLHTAACNGHTQVCRLIIDSIQDKNPLNHFGRTPLQIAQEMGRTEIVRLIQNAMDGGADE